MLRNLSRKGYASLALSQEQGIIILKAFLGQKLGQAFGASAAIPHPKIWGSNTPPPPEEINFLHFSLSVSRRK